jgi:hypothetical protein
LEAVVAVSPQGISIQSLYRSFRDGTLIVNRQYQRKLVWTVGEKQQLIDSILKDYPLPLFLFADKGGPPGQQPTLEVIDGMQRLNAIFSYVEHGFLLPKQGQVSFLGDDCFIRVGSSTQKATGPQIAAVSNSFVKA